MKEVSLCPKNETLFQHNNTFHEGGIFIKSTEQKYIAVFENCDSFIELGRHVAYYRKRSGLTQLKLAKKLNVSRGYLGRIEAAGINQHFSFELFFNICRTLDVPPEDFFRPLPGSEPE